MRRIPEIVVAFLVGHLVLAGAAVYHESVLGRLKIREKGQARELKHQNEMREAFYWEDLREDWQMWKRIEALEARLKELEMTEPRMEDSGLLPAVGEVRKP